MGAVGAEKTRIRLPFELMVGGIAATARQQAGVFAAAFELMFWHVQYSSVAVGSVNTIDENGIAIGK